MQQRGGGIAGPTGILWARMFAIALMISLMIPMVTVGSAIGSDAATPTTEEGTAEPIEETAPDLNVVGTALVTTGTINTTASNLYPLPGEIVSFTITISGMADAGKIFQINNIYTYSILDVIGDTATAFVTSSSTNLSIGTIAYGIDGPGNDRQRFTFYPTVIATGEYSATFSVQLQVDEDAPVGSLIESTVVMYQTSGLYRIGGETLTVSAPATATPTNTPTATPTNTPTATPTNTPTLVPTNTPTATPTNTPTATPTNSPTNTPTATPTNSPTNTPTATPTNTPQDTTGTVTKTASNLNPLPGETVTFTITISGTADAGTKLKLEDFYSLYNLDWDYAGGIYTRVSSDNVLVGVADFDTSGDPQAWRVDLTVEVTGDFSATFIFSIPVGIDVPAGTLIPTSAILSDHSTGFSSMLGTDEEDLIVGPVATATPTNTPTNAPTATPTNTPTATPTNTPTATPTNTPTNTPTATPTNTPTSTPTNTPTTDPPTATAIPTNTPTATPTHTPTNTSTVPAQVVTSLPNTGTGGQSGGSGAGLLFGAMLLVLLGGAAGEMRRRIR